VHLNSIFILPSDGSADWAAERCLTVRVSITRLCGVEMVAYIIDKKIFTAW